MRFVISRSSCRVASCFTQPNTKAIGHQSVPANLNRRKVLSATTFSTVFPSNVAAVHASAMQATSLNDSNGVATQPKRVIVCGGGIIGSAIAYYLTLKGVATTVIERAAIACASSGKAGGFLAVDWQDGGATGALGRLSFKLHQELADTLGKDIGYRRVQTLSAAASPIAKKTGVKLSNTRGAKPGRKAGTPDWLDGSVTKIKPLGDESSTAQVHPQKLSRALMEAAQEKGAQLRIGEVQNITCSNNAVTGVRVGAARVSYVSQQPGLAGRMWQTHSVRIVDRLEMGAGVVVDGEEVAADAVVIAMGPWSGQAAKWLPIPSITGQKYASIVLRPEQEITNHMLFLSYKTSSGQSIEPEVYPRPDGSVYICGVPEHVELPADPNSIQANPGSIEDLKEVARSVSTQLADAPLEVGQSCYLPVSEDGIPVVGKVPSVQGAYIASGHSCWGILNGPATGLVMAELIAEGKAKSVDIRKLDPKRLL